MLYFFDTSKPFDLTVEFVPSCRSFLLLLAYVEQIVAKMEKKKRKLLTLSHKWVSFLLGLFLEMYFFSPFLRCLLESKSLLFNECLSTCMT